MNTVVMPHLDLVISMIEKNIFRPLPVLKKTSMPGEGVGMDEDESLLDPAWPFLLPVYEFFLQLIMNEGA
jgi:serine/threonine-protein phosphatase 2A regulatory subunit B'